MQKILSAENWTEPSSFADWDFMDYVNCPDLGTFLKACKEVERPCPKCGEVELWREIEVAVFENLKCEKCVQEYQNEQKGPLRVNLIDQKQSQVIPPIYLQTDRQRLASECSYRQIREAEDWSFEKEKKSLALFGPTRAGKTRTLCLLLQRLISQGKKVKAYFNGFLLDEIIERIRSEKNLKVWKKELLEVEYLAIDDLFSEKLTERGEATLFELLDLRIAYEKPTIITTQIDKTEGMKRFASPERASAFFARLSEFFQVINCGENKK